MNGVEPAAPEPSAADRRSLVRRRAVFVLLIVAVAVAGFWSGRELRRWRAGVPPQQELPPPRLEVGERLPDVELVEPTGARLSAAEAVPEAGGALIFLEPGCPACGEAVQLWQAWLEAGELEATQIVGVSTSPAELLEEYARQQGLTFPLLRDPAGSFARDFGVAAVPLTVWVAPGRTVARVSYEPPSDEDIRNLHRQIRDYTN